MNLWHLNDMKVILTLQILNFAELYVPFSYIDSFVFDEIKWQCAFTKRTTQKYITRSDELILPPYLHWVHLILNAENVMKKTFGKIVNGRKLLFTVVMQSFVLYVTGNLDLAMKSIKFKVSKNHCNNMSNIFKMSDKDIRMMSGTSIVKFKHVLSFILLILLNLNKQILIGPEKW